jgi:hypothetical protein
MSASKDASSPINRVSYIHFQRIYLIKAAQISSLAYAQAHALSAKASQTAQISSSADNLTRAAVLYDQAADLFEKVKKETSDAGVSCRINPPLTHKATHLLLSNLGRSNTDVTCRSES